MAASTSSAFKRSTCSHRAACAISAGGADEWCHATISPCPASACTTWLPAKPAAPVTSTTRPTLPPVLSLVVRLELRVLLFDRTPPPLVAAVPVDRAEQAGVERFLRCPSECAKLRRVEAVPAVVAGTIRHRLDERRRLAELLEDPVREVDVHHVVAAADVVHL